MMHIISKLDLNKVYDDSVVFIFGCKASGKSWLIKDLLWHKQHIPYGTIMGANYDSTILTNSIKRQTDARKQILEERETHGSCDLDRRAFILMDNCIHNNDWIHDKCMRALLMSNRTLELLPIMSFDSVPRIPPILFCNIDYAFIFRIDDVVERRRIYQALLYSITTFELFSQLMDKYTTNYECLVIYNGSRTEKLEDCVFWYKAEAHPEFNMPARCETET